MELKNKKVAKVTGGRGRRGGGRRRWREEGAWAASDSGWRGKKEWMKTGGKRIKRGEKNPPPLSLSPCRSASPRSLFGS